MASDDAGDTPVSTTVEEDLQQWLDAEADELGISRAELLRRLLSAYQTVSEEDGDLPAGLDGAASLDGPAPADLDARIDDVEADFQRKLEDVRERVVQVKREADAKASADHDHADLHEQLERATGEVSQVRAELDSIQESLEAVREDLDSGFENYEDILEYLTDATDDVEEKLSVLAQAVVDVRTRTATVTARESARVAADDLARRANELGVRTARCEECGLRVDVALLASPECPHCAATFGDVAEGGWFQPATLVVGEVPALESAAVDIEDELEAILDEEER